MHPVKALSITAQNAQTRMFYCFLCTHREKDEKDWEKWFASLSAESIAETNEDTAVKAKQLQSFRWGNQRVWIIWGTLPLLVKQIIHQITSAGVWLVLINIPSLKKNCSKPARLGIFVSCGLINTMKKLKILSNWKCHWGHKESILIKQPEICCSSN